MKKLALTGFPVLAVSFISNVESVYRTKYSKVPSLVHPY